VTEAEWLSSTDAQKMLTFLRDRGASERKLKLAGCACSRRVAPLPADCRLDELVAAAGRVADGEDAGTEVAAILAGLQADITDGMGWSLFQGRAGIAFAAAHPPDNRFYMTAYDWLACAAAWDRVPTATVDPDDWGGLPQDPDWRAVWGREREGQVAILRDIFGNPLHPLVFEPRWRTEAVVSLSRGIYEERAFDRLSVLGDALEDAGCDSTVVLEHCRGPNDHVRGCWLIDEVLQKR
jgi:hypothetical protein